jgi:sigma-B regulation protein RsbU (phosphoserine phosphatase)
VTNDLAKRGQPGVPPDWRASAAGQIDLDLSDPTGADGPAEPLGGAAQSSEPIRSAPPAGVPWEVFDSYRVEAVRRSGLVDTAPEEAFDRLTRLAARVIGTTQAFVTIVDDRRVWFKSRVGAGTEVERFGPVEESLCQYVIGSDEIVVIDDLATDPRTRANPALHTFGAVAWAGVPVRARGGEILGTFGALDTVARHWSEADVELLDTLAQAASGEIALRAALADSEERAVRARELAAAVAVANQRTAEFARTLQRSLLPPELPDVLGLDIAAAYVPASTGEEVVGDFYDVFEGVSGSWCVAVGDVSGKGPEAAALTGLARWTLRAVALRTISPLKVLVRLNEVLLHRRPLDDRHITVALATIRRHRGRVSATICAAGHPLPLLRRADGTIVAAAGPGMAVGWFERPTLSETRTDLSVGDMLVFVTDGVLEARRSALADPRTGEEFGLERLGQVITATQHASAGQLSAAVMDAVEAFRDGPPTDDTAVLVIRVTD